MRNAFELVKKIQNYMESKIFKMDSKKNEKDFTRERKIGFCQLILLILALFKRTSQVELDSLLKKLGFKLTYDMTYSKQAFSEARQKLLPKAFILLNNFFIKEFYKGGYYKKFNKYILLAVDGSLHEIPNNKETQKTYGFATNGKNDSKVARAMTGTLYDVENRVVVCTVFERFDSAERKNAKKLLEDSLELLPNNEEKLILFDRGYPSIEFISFLQLKNFHFLMRAPSSFCTEVNLVKEKDEWVEIKINRGRSWGVKRQGGMLNTGDTVKLRVIKVLLDNEEIETLITDLNEDELPSQNAKELYFKRWGIETKFDELKNKFQIENYTGEKPIIIEQDYYATIFLSNLATSFEAEAQEIANDRLSHKELKYREYRINKSLLIGKLKDELIEILLEEDDDLKNQKFNYMIKEMSRNVVPVKKGRSYERKKVLTRTNKNFKAKKRCF
jgi:hypothetical protein